MSFLKKIGKSQEEKDKTNAEKRLANMTVAERDHKKKWEEWMNLSDEEKCEKVEKKQREEDEERLRVTTNISIWEIRAENLLKANRGKYFTESMIAEKLSAKGEEYNFYMTDKTSYIEKNVRIRARVFRNFFLDVEKHSLPGSTLASCEHIRRRTEMGEKFYCYYE